MTDLFRAFDWVAQNKHRYLIELEEFSKYNKNLMGSCIKPCFKYLDTNVVATEESECFTNCVGKGMESQALFRRLNADADLKRYGGFRG